MATRLLPLEDAPEAAELDKSAPFHVSERWWRSFSAAYGSSAAMAGGLRMREGEDWLGPLRVASLQSATNLQTCYFDAEAEPGTLADLPARLFAETRADQIRFDWLAPDSRLLAAAEGWARRWPLVVEETALSPVVDCTGPFEVYLARCGSTVRKYWRTCRREILEGKRLEFAIVRGGPGLEPLVAELLALEAAGWKGRNGTAILASRADSAFYTSLAPAAAEAGALRLALLRSEGRVVAFEYCLVSEGRVMALKVGYDETLARLQLGHVLALMNIRDACADPALANYDMLSNSLRIAGYKRRFATGYEPVRRLRLFRPTARGRFLQAGFAARAALKRARRRLREAQEARRDSRKT